MPPLSPLTRRFVRLSSDPSDARIRRIGLKALGLFMALVRRADYDGTDGLLTHDEAIAVATRGGLNRRQARQLVEHLVAVGEIAIEGQSLRLRHFEQHAETVEVRSRIRAERAASGALGGHASFQKRRVTGAFGVANAEATLTLTRRLNVGRSVPPPIPKGGGDEAPLPTSDASPLSSHLEERVRSSEPERMPHADRVAVELANEEDFSQWLLSPTHLDYEDWLKHREENRVPLREERTGFEDEETTGVHAVASERPSSEPLRPFEPLTDDSPTLEAIAAYRRAYEAVHGRGAPVHRGADEAWARGIAGKVTGDMNAFMGRQLRADSEASLQSIAFAFIEAEKPAIDPRAAPVSVEKSFGPCLPPEVTRACSERVDALLAPLVVSRRAKTLTFVPTEETKLPLALEPWKKLEARLKAAEERELKKGKKEEDLEEETYSPADEEFYSSRAAWGDWPETG